MSVRTFSYGYWGLAEFTGNLSIVLRGMVVAHEDVTTTVDVVEFAGFYGVAITSDEGFNQNVLIYYCYALPVGTAIPVRLLMEGGLVPPDITADWQFATNTNTWDEMVSNWKAYYIGIFDELIQLASDAVESTVTYTETATMAASALFKIQAAMNIVSPVEPLLFTPSMGGIDLFGGDNFHFPHSENGPTKGRIAAVVSGGGDGLSDVVQALNDISQRTTVMQINNRGAIADLASSDVIVPGGTDVPE